jgi:hypothetical protein
VHVLVCVHAICTSLHDIPFFFHMNWYGINRFMCNINRQHVARTDQENFIQAYSTCAHAHAHKHARCAPMRRDRAPRCTRACACRTVKGHMHVHADGHSGHVLVESVRADCLLVSSQESLPVRQRDQRAAGGHL